MLGPFTMLFIPVIRITWQISGYVHALSISTLFIIRVSLLCRSLWCSVRWCYYVSLSAANGFQHWSSSLYPLDKSFASSRIWQANRHRRNKEIKLNLSQHLLLSSHYLVRRLLSLFFSNACFCTRYSLLIIWTFLFDVSVCSLLSYYSLENQAKDRFFLTVVLLNTIPWAEIDTMMASMY